MTIAIPPAFADSAGVDVDRARRWAQAHLVNEALWYREHQPDIVPFVDRLVALLDSRPVS